MKYHNINKLPEGLSVYVKILVRNGIERYPSIRIVKNGNVIAVRNGTYRKILKVVRFSYDNVWYEMKYQM